jgi:hypothetical protein
MMDHNMKTTEDHQQKVAASYRRVRDAKLSIFLLTYRVPKVEEEGKSCHPTGN